MQHPPTEPKQIMYSFLQHTVVPSREIHAKIQWLRGVMHGYRGKGKRMYPSSREIVAAALDIGLDELTWQANERFQTQQGADLGPDRDA